MIFTFSKEPDGTDFENNQPHLAMSFESQTLPEIVFNFETFLRGCGFNFDGHLDFVEDKKMTANELADALEDKSIRYSESVQDWLDEAKNMLRQQAQEIESLKKELALNYIVRGISKESE
jgi:hypothetical protein